MFAITVGKGFRMTFANGYTVSVQWGNGNYCANQYGRTPTPTEPIYQSADAEVAAWNAAGEWVRLGTGDDVIGYQTTEEVLSLMVRIAAL